MKALAGTRSDILPYRMPYAASRSKKEAAPDRAGSLHHAARTGLRKGVNPLSAKHGEVSRRKDEHISICLHKDVAFRKSNGFEKYDFTHKALPELNLADIDTSTTFMGKRFGLPFFIEALTGGSQKAGEINRNLAQAANALGIGMGVGSQRAMLDNPKLADTYQVREFAPNILLLGNIGATQLVGLATEAIVAMIEAIDADGLVVHLNAAQEICQPEGDSDWRDVLAHIERVCAQVPFPVVVKETGCGIDGQTARHLASAGVACIDIAGAGGTSFTKVEAYRSRQEGALLGEWGIPTAESLRQCRQSVALPLISSGGMRNGVECAKAIAMGASLAGFALPLLQAAQRSDADVIDFLTKRGEELRKTMFLIGARNIDALRQAVIRPRPAD